MTTVSETKAEKDARLLAAMREHELREFEELADHPNAVIRSWRMLPRSNYGAALQGERVVGYHTGLIGESKKFMPLTVVKRLIRSGQITWGLFGGSLEDPGLWIQVNEQWKPKQRRARR